MKREHKDIIFLIPTVIVLVGLFIVTGIYSENMLNSDISSELVLAKELLREHKLFTQNWFYSTEVRVINTQLISVILLSFMDSWSSVRMVMNLICQLLVIISYLYMMKPLKMDKKFVYLSTALLMIPFSREYLLIVQFGNSYMPHFILCFTAVGLALRLFMKAPQKKNKVLFILVLMGCGVSGIRYALILVLPLLATVVLQCGAERYVNQKPVFHREFLSDRRVKTALAGFLGYLAGYLVNVLYFGRYYTYEKYDNLYMADFKTHGLSERLGTMIIDIFRLFGYTDSASIKSFAGIQDFVAIGFTVILVYMIWRVYYGGRKEQENREFIKIFALMSLAMNILVFLIFDYMYEKRYFMLTFIFFVPLLVMYFENYRKEFRELSRGISVVFVTACIILCSFNLRQMAVSKENDELKAVKQFLVEKHADFGMATYWNGNVLTELSDGEIQVINIDDYKFIYAYEWLMPKRFLEKSTWETIDSEKFFVLLHFTDLANMGLDGNAFAYELLSKGELVYLDNGYSIYFYDRETFIDTYASYICND